MHHRALLKRIFDLLFVVWLAPFWIPLGIFVALTVRLKIGKSILFYQERPGLHGNLFTLYKFRTMSNTRDSFGNLLPDRSRITSFGKLIRSTSLDELPELINVLKGDMSLVGPRPLLMQYIDRYTPEQARRHEVKPGITGWAQVNGRNAITWEDKFRLDVWYVDNMTLGLDMKIIVMTIWSILKRDGINQPGQATAEEFLGSSSAGLDVDRSG